MADYVNKDVDENTSGTEGPKETPFERDQKEIYKYANENNPPTTAEVNIRVRGPNLYIQVDEVDKTNRRH